MSEAAIRTQLLEEDDADMDITADNDGDSVTAAAMLIDLLKLEDQQ